MPASADIRARNIHRKITRPVFECWMRLLAAMPGSLLWLIDDTANDVLRAQAAARGIDQGLIIQTVNYEPVRSAAEFAQKIAAAKAAGRSSVLLSVLGPRGQHGDVTVRFTLQPAG